VISSVHTFIMCAHLHLLYTVNQGQEILKQYDTQQSRGSTTAAPHDVIETID
jgi:hypothetical protein